MAPQSLAEDSAKEPLAEDEMEIPNSLGPVRAKMPWAGLDVGKLNEAMRAHASGVPPGVGFLVTAVATDGPAAHAGVKSYDILWKLDDQLLINEAQFATLLQMHRPGDVVTIDVVRSGKPETFELTLAKSPQTARVRGLSPVDLTLVPAGVPGMPKTIVYPQQRIAEVSREDGGLARLHHVDDEPVVVITDAEGEVIYDGPVRRDGRISVPKSWRCSVGALLRTMDQASESNWHHRRKPRPRVVVPPSSDSP
ncbi:MAG: PDZ domain-containing protein [Verrucomicrobiales bacterium]